MWRAVYTYNESISSISHEATLMRHDAKRYNHAKFEGLPSTILAARGAKENFAIPSPEESKGPARLWEGIHRKTGVLDGRKRQDGGRARKRGPCLSSPSSPRRSSRVFPALASRRHRALISRSGRNSEPGKPETFQIYLGWRKFNLKWRLRYNGSLRYSVTQPPARPTHLNFATLVRSPSISLSSSTAAASTDPCRYLWGNRMPWLARELLKGRHLHPRRRVVARRDSPRLAVKRNKSITVILLSRRL